MGSFPVIPVNKDEVEFLHGPTPKWNGLDLFLGHHPELRPDRTEKNRNIIKRLVIAHHDVRL
jgi:hypothetical protein